MTEVQPLTQALAELDAALHELCDPTEGAVLRDGLKMTQHTGQSLLQQVASLGHGGRAGGYAGQPSRAPLDIAKLNCWNEIQMWSTDTHDRVVTAAHLTPEDYLRRSVQLAHEARDPAIVGMVLDRVRMMVRMAKAVLDPQHRYRIAAACPECSVRTVMVDDPDTSEQVQDDALRVDMEADGEKFKHIWCQACGAVWPPQKFEFLGRLLGCEPIQEAS